MAQNRTPVKIYLSAEERQILDQQAKQLGVHRGEMIRERALSAPQQAAGLPQGPQVYADALEAAARSYSGIPRVAMAGIVSAVIKSLATHWLVCHSGWAGDGNHLDNWIMQITDQLTALIKQQEQRSTERLQRQLQRTERMQSLLQRLRETEG